MANFVFDKGAESIMNGTTDLLTNTIKISLVDGASWTPNQTTDQYYDAGGGTGAKSGEIAVQTLGSKTVGSASARAFDAADPTFPSVGAGGPYEYLVIWHDTGTETTSPLLAVFDTATGLPITTNGNNVDVVFAAAGIFKL